MNNINFKDIKVLSGSLDIKYNEGKTLSEILSQLQTGAQITATVAKTMLSGEMILITSFGKMITENKLNLVHGDIINIELLEIGEIIEGNILTVNNQATGKPDRISLELLNTARLLSAENLRLTDLSAQNTDKLPVDTKNINNIPKEISGSISYLNLSKIDRLSNIFRIINTVLPQAELNDRSVKSNVVSNKIDLAVNSNAAFGLPGKATSTNLLVNGGVGENSKQLKIPYIPVSLNIVSDNGSEPSAFSFQGIVSGNEKDNRQLIKTDFGIITAEDTNLRIGQRLILSFLSLNNKPVNNDLIKPIADFLFTINSLPTLRDLSLPALNFNSKNLGTPSELRGNVPLPHQSALKSSEEKLPKKSVRNDHLNNIVKELKNNGELKKIIEEYRHIKTLLSTDVKLVQPDFNRQSLFVPIYNGYEIEEHEMKIIRTEEKFLRFVLNINFSENPMQLDGLIQFELGSKKPKSFHMTLRSKNTVDEDFRKAINEIFAVNQEITGIRGAFTIERTDDFESF